MANILLIQQTATAYNLIESAMSYDAHTLRVVRALDVDIRSNPPDLIILQMVEALNDDLCFCETLRALPDFAKIPVLAVSDTKSAHCAADALDGGCDDFVCQPIPDRILAARVRALLRRKPQILTQNVLVLNSQARTAQFGNRDLGLTRIEYELLQTLCNRPGQHLSASALLQEVWHYPPGQGDEALVRNHVRNLRRKLESDPERPRILLCFQGRGYTITAEIQQH